MPHSADRDAAGRPIVAVTGMGVLTSLGRGQRENWAALTAGRSGIRRITRFPTEAMRTTIAGTVDFMPLSGASAPALSEQLAETVIEEALEEAGLLRPAGQDGAFPGPLFLALPPVELEWAQRRALMAAAPAANEAVADTPDMPASYAAMLRAAAAGGFQDDYRRFLFGSVADNLAERFGTQGAPISTSTACASGGTAIQLGLEAIRRGETDLALCVGTDASINPESIIRFSLLSALSTRNDPPSSASRPFSKDREGFVMAEGAGALVLESLAHARARGAAILGVIEGAGEMADSFHRTRSSPDGRPIIGCLRRGLEDAGLAPEQIGYINAHGTGTPENDKMEWLGVSTVFGERASTLPMSSNKSMIGHSLTAAGAVEAVFTLLSLRHQLLPPTINYDIADPALPVDC
ncbi:MAG: beta-ketoacyl-ACP synthase, partial [Rhodospirillales bacterium]|nr:beta-ketoacyl-ACP synthase [Rhodospirillales bacterium]